MLTVKALSKYGVGAEMGIRIGDRLQKIESLPVEDIIDYLYWDSQEFFVLTIQRGGKILEFEIEKDADESLGLDFFEEIGTNTCSNNCIFCFVNQLPKGLRQTLYVKDDDWRLSLLNGNFITLTNLTEKEFQKILFYKISPLYVSVHATLDDVRARLLRSRNDSSLGILEKIKQLHSHGIHVHAQAVIVPGQNDGQVLEKTILQLDGLVKSLAIVPAGITKYHRCGVPHTDEATARRIIDTVRKAQQRAKQERFVFCSDEMYIRANLDIPHVDTDSQLGNGVGLIEKFRKEFESELGEAESYYEGKSGRFDLATGVDNFPYLDALLKKLTALYPKIEVRLHKIVNHFFGETITVSGLVTGGDIEKQLKGKLISKTLFIPDCMLIADGELFLDNMDISTLAKNLSAEIVPLRVDGGELVRTILV